MNNTSSARLIVGIVDDSAALRQRVAESLAALPRVIVGGQSGDVPDGLRMLADVRPHVLVLDIELPTQSGMELLRAAKDHCPPPVVIMLSIYDHPGFRQRCVELGADYYFNKLTEFERVADVCRELAERAQ